MKEYCPEFNGRVEVGRLRLGILELEGYWLEESAVEPRLETSQKLGRIIFPSGPAWK